MNSNSKWVTILAAVAGVMLLSGCMTPSFHATVGQASRTYFVSDIAVGDTWNEFRFTDAHGEVRRLSAVRGRVTALVFTEDTQLPDCERLKTLDDVTRRAYYCHVPVVIVYVTPSDGPLAELKQTAMNCMLSRPRTIVVTDPGGDVRRLYGGDAIRGRYVLMDNFLRVISIGDANDLATLEAEAKALAEKTYRQDYREGKYEFVGWTPPDSCVRSVRCW
jgi:hypothetical protein